MDSVRARQYVCGRGVSVRPGGPAHCQGQLHSWDGSKRGRSRVGPWLLDHSMGGWQKAGQLYTQPHTHKLGKGHRCPPKYNFLPFCCILFPTKPQLHYHISDIFICLASWMSKQGTYSHFIIPLTKKERKDEEIYLQILICLLSFMNSQFESDVSGLGSFSWLDGKLAHGGHLRDTHCSWGSLTVHPSERRRSAWIYDRRSTRLPFRERRE